MRNLTNVLEGLLDADFDVSENDLPVSIIKRMLEDKASYMEIYKKIMFDLSSSLQSCPVAKTLDYSKDYTIILLPKVNSVRPKIQIFTKINSKCWSGIDIVSGAMLNYMKMQTSIYKPPKNSRSYVAYLLPKEVAQELKNLI